MHKGNKKSNKVKGKARLAPGGKINPEMIQQGAGMAGMAGATIDPLIKETNVAGKAATGALKGAAAGASFGPIGMAAGAVIGGVASGIGASKAKKAEEQAKLEQQRLNGINNLNNAFANAGNQFKHGGRILAKKLNVVQGGNLSAISDDAVEVKANQPSKSDSVELDNAYVDHNEVIDRKNRVYSDSIFLPNGKSVAKEAKKLEKQKAEDYELRFASVNKHIDSKLDKLFAYQEASKPKTFGERLKNGGVIDPPETKKINVWDRPTNTGLNLEKVPTKKSSLDESVKRKLAYNTDVEVNDRVKQEVDSLVPMWDASDTGVTNYEQKMDSLSSVREKYRKTLTPAIKDYVEKNLGSPREKLKSTYKRGGKLKPTYELGTDQLLKVAPLPKKFDFTLPTNKDGVYETPAPVFSSTGSPLVQGKPESPKINWGDKLQTASTALATFGPNIASDILRTKLKGPKTPFLEQGVRLKRLSPDAQLAAASQQTRQAQEIVRRSTAQGSDAVAAQGSLLARRLNANNEIYGNINNANAQIQAQEAGLNSSIRARNTERTNQFRDNQVEFNNKLQQLKSENIANLSSKILAQGRERNQMKLDAERFAWTSKQFEDSGVLARAAKDPQLLESINANQKKLGLPLYEVGADGVLKQKSKFGGKLQYKLSKKK